MITMESVEASDFEVRVGERFTFRLPSAYSREPDAAELELLRVTRMEERPQGLTVRGVPIRSKPFSLLFGSATHYPHLEFATATLDHPGFASMQLLLVCVTSLLEKPGAIYYQAIFN